MLKRIIAVCLSCIMLAATANTAAAKLKIANTAANNAEDVNSADNDYCLSENDIIFTYEFNKDCTLTITGLSDETKELLYSNKKMYIDTLIIPATLTIDGQIYPVSTIGKEAIILQRKANNVVLQEGIKYIKEFFITAQVKSITLPSTLQTIDALAFAQFSTNEIKLSGKNPYYRLEDNILLNKDGTSLVWAPLAKGTFRIPEHVTKISDGAFAYNLKLKKVVMHKNVNYIGDYAFYECEHLNAVFPKKLDYLGEYAFMYASLSELKELPRVKKVGAHAFCSTHLTQIALPEGIQELGAGAFKMCSQVSKLYIPASLKVIGTSAFQLDGPFNDYYSRLKSKNITISKYNKNYSVIDGCLCNKAGTKLIRVLAPEVAFTVPDSVTEISEGAMSFNYIVEKVTFNSKCKVIPKDCLDYCTKLSSVIIPASVNEIKENALESLPGEVTRTIIFKGTTPPSIYRNLPKEYNSLDDVYAYDDSFQLLRIKVPKGCESKYKAAFEKVKFVYATLEEE